MTIVNLLSKFPWWCWAWRGVTIVLVIFHVRRGHLGQRYYNRDKRKLPGPVELWWVVYVHDALLHAACTLFGSACILVCILVAISIAQGDISQLCPGQALLLVSSSLLGLAGITGQLAVMLYLGRMPGMR